jgi:subtilisin family serine protease
MGGKGPPYPDAPPYPWRRHGTPVIAGGDEPSPPLRPRRHVIPPPAESLKPQAGRSVARLPPGPIAKNPLLRPNTGVPAASEHRFVSDEILLELRPDVSPQSAATIGRRERLQLLASQHLELSGTTVYRYRIKGERSAASTIRTLQADPKIAAVQPNYLYTLQADQAGEFPGIQYAAAKLHLAKAHAISNGAHALVAVIDSGIDRNHPEILDAVKEFSGAPGIEGPPAVHGTAVAGIIAAHAALVGVAPQAGILAFRAFAASNSDVAARGMTFDVLAGIEWSKEHGARVVNMSFAGPADPLLSRELAGGTREGLVFVAPVGNAGSSAAPLYPAADENVIAVTATDRSDGLFKDANHCPGACIAAPGVDVLVAEPGEAYGLLSGTSLAAAHVSGVAALLLDANPNLEVEAIRRLLIKTARHPETVGRGTGIADAYGALEVLAPSAALGAMSAQQ